MKKMMMVLAAIAMLLNMSAAMAEGMGVKVIGWPPKAEVQVSLDDFQLNVDAEISGYGVLHGTDFEITDQLGYYGDGCKNVYSSTNDYYTAGIEAEYAILRMDILNTGRTAHDYLEKSKVKVIFDDVYEFEGWVYQSDYTRNPNPNGPDANKQNVRWSIQPEDNFEIQPMYMGHYIFGCTLPNAAVNSDAPLTMIITIDGHEITYNIR